MSVLFFLLAVARALLQYIRIAEECRSVFASRAMLINTRCLIIDRNETKQSNSRNEHSQTLYLVHV